MIVQRRGPAYRHQAQGTRWELSAPIGLNAWPYVLTALAAFVLVWFVITALAASSAPSTDAHSPDAAEAGAGRDSVP